MLAKEEKISIIKLKIESLGYKVLAVVDESYKHSGHQGYSDTGSHFHAKISASFSSSMEKIRAQKEIMKQFLDLIPNEIHALSLEFQ